jgi:hydroxymethylpyrimidine/phosphomethylpyrimidine kinase
VLAIGGHDPSGAGIQADIETAAAHSCHAVSLVTCLTVQNTGCVHEVIPTRASTLRNQFALLQHDLRAFGACKIGLIPTLDVLDAIIAIVQQLPADTAVVLDPVIAAGSGPALMQDEVRQQLVERLWPLVTVCTPNRAEARLLAEANGAANLDTLMQRMGGWTLLKGADDSAGADVVHQLYRDGACYATYSWPRLDGRFHGSGCTLASAIAARLASGHTVASAVGAGLAYTWRTLLHPLDIGGVQYLPRRWR